jgi:isocitrate/isopropylmalate dehydrogenase
MLVAFSGDDLEPTALMAEAAHGTAPSLKGKDVANPLAMILAAAALLAQTDDESGRNAGRAIREAALEAISQGVKTADLGGSATSSGFTTDVILRTRSKLEVWSTL